MRTVHEIIREAESTYLQGNTKLGQHVNWSMHDTIERIDAYLNSKHTSGDTDSLGREKPFFNIVTAAVNIWYRATDIDRKDIKFIPTTQKSMVLAFVANVLLQNWMNKNRFGHFLNAWGRALSRYGSAVPKFVEKGNELFASVVAWNRLIVDSVDFDALPRIEKFYKTPAQLRQIKEYDQDVVSSLIEATVTRKTLDKHQQDNQNDFIELYEVHGLLDSHLLQDDPDDSLDDSEIVYLQQMHVVSYVREGGRRAKEFQDFTLFKGKEAKDPYMITHLIEEDGRTLAIGAVEYLFDAQWMQNHTIKNMKDTLDLSSRLIFQTADSHFVGRNVLTAIETGEIMIHEDGKPLERIANDKPDIVALQNFGQLWRNMAQEITSTPDVLRGNTLPSGTPYSLGAFQGANANSLFEIMTENKGLAIEDIMKTFVIPFLKKQLRNKKEIVAILDDAGIQEIDSMYIPQEAIKRFNTRAKETILNGGIPSPFQPQQAQQQIQQEMASQGNKRFFVPSEIDDTTWSELFSDFEWDSIQVEVTNEQVDKREVLTTLNTVLQTIASNPMILNNPNSMQILSAILRHTGAISPIQLTATTALPPPRPTIRVTEGIDFKDLAQYPDAQQQMLAGAGINVEPQKVGGGDLSIQK